VEGILEIAEGGFGFLRFHNFLTSDKDIYVSPSQIRRFNLKTGDMIRGITRRPNEGEKFGPALRKYGERRRTGRSDPKADFDDLTPIFLESEDLFGERRDGAFHRLIDLVAAIERSEG
jgi:transcription termination factor Rho